MTAERSDPRPPELLSDSLPAVIIAVVGFESESKICSQAAAAYQRLLGELNQSVAAVLDAQPVQFPCLAGWISEVTTAEKTRDVWKMLGDDCLPVANRRADGVTGPQCVLLLPASRLVENEWRRSLATALASARDQFGCFLLIFLDETGTLLQPNCQEDTLGGWVRDFEVLAPARVCIYLASSTFDSGQPIEPNDLAEAVVVPLCADLIIPRPDSPRVLTNRASEALGTLSTFGVRGLQFDPASVADRLVGRFTGDLLQCTLFNSHSHKAKEAVS